MADDELNPNLEPLLESDEPIDFFSNINLDSVPISETRLEDIDTTDFLGFDTSRPVLLVKAQSNVERYFQLRSRLVISPIRSFKLNLCDFNFGNYGGFTLQNPNPNNQPVGGNDDDLEQFRSLYGMSPLVFAVLVEHLMPHLADLDIGVGPYQVVKMVLARLANGYSAEEMESRYSLEPLLISKVTELITRTLATKLYHHFISPPGELSRLLQIAEGFERIMLLPSVCGAIDGSSVKLHEMNVDGNSCNLYKCKHGYDSVLLEVVADQGKVFWNVCVRAPGSADDATHFRSSLLYERLMCGNIVADEVVNVGRFRVRPYVVGDCCYPLLPFLMTPFSPNLSGTPEQNLFDEMLMKGKSAVVDAIGLLKGRWRILQDLNVGIREAAQTIVACCVLHNLCQIAKEPEPQAGMWMEPNECGAPATVLKNEVPLHDFGKSLRQALAEDLQQRIVTPR